MVVGDQNDLIGSMKVNKSENNKVFYEFIMFMTKYKKKFFAVVSERFGSKIDHHAIIGSKSLNDMLPDEIDEVIEHIKEGQYDSAVNEG